jgi:hypothetical protein
MPLVCRDQFREVLREAQYRSILQIKICNLTEHHALIAWHRQILIIYCSTCPYDSEAGVGIRGRSIRGRSIRGQSIRCSETDLRKKAVSFAKDSF